MTTTNNSRSNLSWMARGYVNELQRLSLEGIDFLEGFTNGETVALFLVMTGKHEESGLLEQAVPGHKVAPTEKFHQLMEAIKDKTRKYAKTELQHQEDLENLTQQLKAALFIATFGHAALVGARTKHALTGKDSELTDLEANILAKDLIVDVQVEIIRTASESDLRSLLGKIAINPLHMATLQADAIMRAHVALLEALPHQVIARILRDQDTRRRQIRQRETHSSDSHPPAESPGQR